MQTPLQNNKNRIQTQLEEQNKMGDMQNGFRKKRSINDSIFTITQMIELAKHEKKPLFCAFIDIKEAFDKHQQRFIMEKSARSWSTII